MVHGVLQSEDTQKPEGDSGGPNVLPYPRATSALGSARAPCEVRRRLLGFTPTVNPLWMPFYDIKPSAQAARRLGERRVSF